MKIHCTVAVLVVIAGLILGISVTEWCICLGLFGMVMALELVNTAVEAVVDLVTEERKPPSGKDCQGHSSRSSTDRSDHGGDCRADHFCSERACFSGNIVEIDQVHGTAVAVFRKGELLWN